MSSRIILITGANQGIGFELVNQLSQTGHTIYLGTRSIEKGKDALQKIEANARKNVHVLQLDVTDPKSVTAAVKQFQSEQKHLDVLVNNAGILIDGKQRPTEANLDTVKDTFETNVFGVIRVTSAFVPLLKLSSNPIILNVSSILGSISGQNDPNSPIYSWRYTGYNSSKAALNAYTVALAGDFPEARVNSIHPGYVITNINKGGGVESTENSAKGVIKEGILLEKSGPTGQFLDYTGKRWDW